MLQETNSVESKAKGRWKADQRDQAGTTLKTAAIMAEVTHNGH